MGIDNTHILAYSMNGDIFAHLLMDSPMMFVYSSHVTHTHLAIYDDHRAQWPTSLSLTLDHQFTHQSVHKWKLLLFPYTPNPHTPIKGLSLTLFLSCRRQTLRTYVFQLMAIDVRWAHRTTTINNHIQAAANWINIFRIYMWCVAWTCCPHIRRTSNAPRTSKSKQDAGVRKRTTRARHERHTHIDKTIHIPLRPFGVVILHGA